MTFKLDIDYEVMDQFVAQSIKDTLETLATDYAKAVETGKGWVFSTDGAEDAKQLKKMIKALVRVHNWYEEPNHRLEINDYV